MEKTGGNKARNESLSAKLDTLMHEIDAKSWK